MRDRDTGWVHADWGKGGTDGSGLLCPTVSATPNFIREKAGVCAFGFYPQGPGCTVCSV